MSEDLDAFCPKCKRYKGVGYCPYCSPEKEKEFKEKCVEDLKKAPPEEKKFDFEAESKGAIDKVKEDLVKKIFEGFTDAPAEEIKDPTSISLSLKILKLPSVVYFNTPIKCEIEVDNQSILAVPGHLIGKIQEYILYDQPVTVNAQEKIKVAFEFKITNDKYLNSVNVEFEYKIPSGLITKSNRRMSVLKK